MESSPICGAAARTCSEEEAFCPFDRAAVAAMLEYGVRHAGRRGKITARFVDMADLAREAYYAAAAAGESVVQRGACADALLDAKMERHNLIETQIREMIEEGTLLLIDTTGRARRSGEWTERAGNRRIFVRQTRAHYGVRGAGKTGLINIERESNLSGRFHDKGVQIISGYLRRRFAQDKPLSLAASICFEQSYSGVDGDSASSTEVYALLSALSEIAAAAGYCGDRLDEPARRHSGDWRSERERSKDFSMCAGSKGLTGTQGVMIPAENVEDLMLRDDVIAAAAKAYFISTR